MRGGWRIALGLALAAAGAARAADVSKACDVGPVTRNFGGAPWLVYSCHDTSRLLFVAPPVNPAAPGTIVLSRAGGMLHIDSVSTGDRRVVAEAGAAILGLAPEEFDALIGQTKAP